MAAIAMTALEPAPQQVYPGASLSTEICAYIARQMVGEVLGVLGLDLRPGPRGTRVTAVSRQLAMHLVQVVAGRTYNDTAQAFGRHRSTTRHNCEVVEDLRDVDSWDGFITILERRYALLLEYTALPGPRDALLKALKGIDHALDEGDLEGDAHAAGEYMVETLRALT